ncbi:Hypothetical predicted protein [Octopus vulgaris]|uniref:Uncharacterized protein n=2 Tax=Octopus TaxID=6643 RepID=A0AA36FI76_OCTVU|nr:uncharacterized protein LOC115222949 [Octopus sinensis]CAI9738562.1 Hypothetical predicted protein [Octopus vulgaris]
MALSSLEISDLESRRSLYDIERSRFGEGASLVHRLIYIGNIKNRSEEPSVVLSQLQEDILYLREKEGEIISGLLVMYQVQFFVVLESSEKYISALIQHLKSAIGGKLIKRVKLLVMSHDVFRLFRQMHFCLLDIHSQNMEVFETLDTIEKLQVDLIQQILLLGAHLNQQHKGDFQRVLETMSTRNPALLPQQALIHYLLKNEEEGLTIEQLIDMFTKPFDIVLQNDLVWPLQKYLYPNDYME